MAQFGSGRSNGPTYSSNGDQEHEKNAVLNQMLDLFLDCVEVEAIQSVLESCEYDYERSKIALQLVSLKDVSKTTAEQSTPPSLPPPLPQLRHPEHQRVQHGNPMPAPPGVVNDVNKLRQSPSKLVSLPPRSANQADQTLERIRKYIHDGNKILVLMRGCPGSGKSFLAHQLVQWCGGERSNHVFSADDYFIKNGKYVFNRQELPYAHKFTQHNVLRAVRNSFSPVVVDNTNTQLWEMQGYVIMAVNHGYAVETLEPQTPWRFNHAQLVRRNVHSVTPSNIRAMLDRYEHGLTGEDIIKQLKLVYLPSKNPPQPARRIASSRSPDPATSPVKSLRSPEVFSPHSTKGASVNILPPLSVLNQICSQPIVAKEEVAAAVPLLLQPEGRNGRDEVVATMGDVVTMRPSLQPERTKERDEVVATIGDVVTMKQSLQPQRTKERDEVVGTTGELVSTRPSLQPQRTKERDEVVATIGDVVTMKQSLQPQRTKERDEVVGTTGELVSTRPSLQLERTKERDEVVATSGDVVTMEQSLQPQRTKERDEVVGTTGELVSTRPSLQPERTKERDEVVATIGDVVTMKQSLQPQRTKERDEVVRTTGELVLTRPSLQSEGRNGRDEVVVINGDMVSTRRPTSPSQFLLSLEEPADFLCEGISNHSGSTAESNDTETQRQSSDDLEIGANLIDLDADLTKSGVESKLGINSSQPLDIKEGAWVWGDADWEEQKQAVENRNSIDCRVDQRQRWQSSKVSDAKVSQKEERNYGLLESNVWDGSEAACSWGTVVQMEKNDGQNAWSQREPFVPSKNDASSNTNYRDFLLISNNTPLTEVPPGMRLVEATGRNINENLVTYVPPIPKKIVVDVSSMTDDESGTPVKGSLNELLRLFPHVSLGNLETLLETCHGDVNWASNCLLDTDSGVRLDVPFVPGSEDPSSGPPLDIPRVADTPRQGPVELNSYEPPPRSKSLSKTSLHLGSEENISLSQTTLHRGSEENTSLRRSNSLPLVTPQCSSIPLHDSPPTAPLINSSRKQDKAPSVSSGTPKKKPSLYPVLPDENETKLFETSDESETSSQDDDEMLEFVISPEFSQQLFCRFGGPQNKFRKSGLSPLLRIPESIACQIHYYLVLSQQEYYADDNEEEDEDEEAVLDVQDKVGHQLFEQMCAEKPLTKQEQEDMELAREIYELDLAAIYNSKDTMATVLARRHLKDTFPTLDPNILEELLEVHGNSFHRTKEMIQENYLNCYTVKQKDFPALSESQTKTASRNRSDICDRVRLRKEADGELQIARIYKQKAKEQSAKREWSAAAVYSQMAKAHKRQYSKTMQLTVQGVLAKNLQSHCPSSLDLHCLVVEEALVTLDVFLDEHILSLADTPHIIKSLYIITGRGKHSSGGVPKIRPAVLRRLDDRYLENTLENPGLVKVKVTARSLLSHEC